MNNRKKNFSNTIYRYFIYVVIAGILSLSSGCAYLSQAQQNEPEVSSENPAENELEVTDQEVIIEPKPATKVVALGRLVPKGEVIKLSVPNAEDSRVNQLLVEEGDFVKAGQVIAILQGIERRTRDLEEAQKNVDFYQAKLEQIKSGDSKQAEIAAQRANIARLEAQLRNEALAREADIASAEAALNQAKLSYERRSSLVSEGAIATEEKDLAKEQLDTAEANIARTQAQLNNTIQTLQEQITQEQRNLATLQEVRPVDVKVAEIELERAMITVKQRESDVEDTKVKVPMSGQILQINTRVGEQVNTAQGIVELGQTSQMYAVAEVYETEISKVKKGQIATITSEYGGFAGEVTGRVDYISLHIGKQQLSEGSSNPARDENSRVVEVKILIDSKDNTKVAKFTNMQVRVEIDLNS